MVDNKFNDNTRNKESVLFKRLTRLLAGPLVNRRTQTGRRLRRIDLDRFSSRFNSASGQNFKKTSYDPFSNLQANVMSNQHRVERYVDFDQMEYTPEIASGLDLIADEMTAFSSLQPILEINCPNEELKSILKSLYYDVINVEFNLFGWCRTMCKYGDFFLYLDIDDARGVQNVIGLPIMEVERLEGEDKTNPNYVQFQWNTAGMTFENWQMAHFRILGNDKYAPYGTSFLEASRRIWRQLTLLEDAMMAYRIVRSPERRAFYIDVGNIPPQDVEQYMQKIMTQMKRHQVVDPDTGRVDLRYNPLSIEEDYFIPVRGESGTKIESIKGGQYTGDIDDVKYLRDKLFAALKIPQAYLTNDENSNEDKTTLAQKDIRFARTVQRLQRSIVSELEKIGIIHLYILGYRDSDLISFNISLNNPSKLAELQELEHWKSKFDIAASATEGFFSRRWIAKKMFSMADEEFVRNQREMFYDRMFDASLEAAAENTAAESTGMGGGGGGMGGLGGDLGGELGAEAGEAAAGEMGPGEMGAGGPEAGAEGPEEAGALLAEPGKRDEDWYKIKNRHGQTTTSGSKMKWYTPVTHDHRKTSGPREKNIKGQYARETAKATPRNLFKGNSELMSLVRGIFEEQATNYDSAEEIERNIFSTNQQVKTLLEGLETREKDET